MTATRSTRRIFVSSTCHDLIDVRGEIRDLLEGEGFLLSMSDEPDTFELDGRSDSIETCLVNLRASDAVVVVLSQRYGPALTPLNTTKSATHVEYDEAIKHGKLLYVYVRDRLMAVYDQWAAGGRKEIPVSFWCKQQDAEGLLKLIDDHKKLEAAKTATNWFSIFSNSIDLKSQLRTHLSAYSGKILLERLHRDGRLGVLSLSVERPPDGPPHGTIANNHHETFCDVHVRVESGRSSPIGDLAPGKVTRFDGVGARDTKLIAEWSSPLCGAIHDTYTVNQNGICRHIKRKLVNTSGVVLLGPDDT